MTATTSPVPDGIVVAETVRPHDVNGVALVLRDATAGNRPVMPFGGGTSLGTGSLVDEPFLGLDLRGLSGVREYQPTDLTASFWAGTPVREVVTTLAEHGQELPLDLPRADRATIGGLVATGFAGPRRLGSGSLKDLLIGCSYVRGDGLVAKAGGMLVKNVSGFEIARLLHGSWGSLAVITSVNLKVVPKPKADLTISSRRFDDLERALAVQAAVLKAHSSIGASIVEGDASGWSLHVRLLGRQRSLRALLGEIRAELGDGASEHEGDAFWTRHADRWAGVPGQVQVVVGGQPRAMGEIASTIAQWHALTRMTLSRGTGSLRLQLDPAKITSAALRARLATVEAMAPTAWLVESAPVDWKRGATIWGPTPDGLGVMQSVKREFDPAGVLNRGRLSIDSDRR